MQRCPNCQNPLPPKANFCRQCCQAIQENAAKVAQASGATPSTVAEPSPLAAAKAVSQSAKQPAISVKPPVDSGKATMAEGSMKASDLAKAMEASNPPQASDSSGDGEYEGGGATLFGVEGSLGVSNDAAAPPPNQNPNADLVGQTIGGGYKIEKKLGEGGMGAVYKASHPAAKALAIKVLHSEFTSEPKVLERFFNEAKAVNKINQPHIVDISDFGFLANGQPYIAMEFLEGMDLAGRIQQQSPLVEAEALDVTIQVLEALYAAHQVNIIHRDMKPENIFLLKNKKQPDKWFVKVLDFGIAKLSQANSQQTQSGTILGTPRYMSPEQARGEREIGPGADIYSLGIIIYELVTGRAPFDEPSYLGYLVAHQRKVPPRPREINPGVSEDTDRAIMRCLEKTPDKRYPTAKDLRDDLVVALQKLGGPVRLQTPLKPMEVVKDPKNPTFMLSEEVQTPSAPKAPESKSASNGAPDQNVIHTAKLPRAEVPAPPNPNPNTPATTGGSTKTIGIVVAAVIALALIVFLLMK